MGPLRSWCGGCESHSLWNGNGTVKVLVTDVNKNAASQELQKKVADYIETVRPIGATVTVTAPAYLNINVTANVKVNQEYLQDYASVLKNTLDAYLVDIDLIVIMYPLPKSERYCLIVVLFQTMTR